MREEHLRVWLRTKSQEESPDDTHCREVVALIQMYFREGHLV